MPHEPSTFHKANKNALGGWVVQRFLLERGLRKGFGGVYVRLDPAAERLRGAGSRTPIFCMTHSGWFDGHMAALLNARIFRHDTYLMMEEANLARYWFFTWAGVFGIERDNPRSALASIEYIVGVLKGAPSRSLWIFPQGTMRHPDDRPLKLYSGVAGIARRLGECYLVPVAVRYDFMLEQAPDAFARVGAPILYGEHQGSASRQVTERLRLALEAEAEKLHADVSAYDLRGYRRILRGRGSANKVWDGVIRAARRVRALLPGGPEA